MNRHWRVGSLLFMVGLGFIWFYQPAQPTQAALWSFKGVHEGPEISVCFAGDATALRPDRVREILTFMQNFEYAANIRFMTPANTRAMAEIQPGGILGRLACPAATNNGAVDYFAGDLRIAIPNTNVPFDGPGLVPGNGCTQERKSSSWAHPPGELELWRSCQYNVKLGDDRVNLRTGILNPTPWLNHTLHEVGHALGLGHDHARADENANCVPAGHGDYHTANAGYMTPYDKDSVMHYQFTVGETPLCEQIGSNYSDSNFTDYDRLALHILYPEDQRVAEFVGTTVIRESELLRLKSAWMERGANINFVASDFIWEIAGNTYTGPTLEIDLGVGEYTLEFSHLDFLGRDYHYSGLVRVLDQATFNAEVVAPIAAHLPIEYPNYYHIFNASTSMQPDLNVSFFMPQGLFPSSVVIDYARQPPPEVSMTSIGLSYEILVTELETGEPAAPVPGQTYSVTITYEDLAIAPSDEARLGLYYLDGENWVLEASSSLDMAAKRITAFPSHFSTWAVLAPKQLYLPITIR